MMYFEKNDGVSVHESIINHFNLRSLFFIKRYILRNITEVKYTKRLKSYGYKYEIGGQTSKVAEIIDLPVSPGKSKNDSRCPLCLCGKRGSRGQSVII